jgi:hypothetical protein
MNLLGVVYVFSLGIQDLFTTVVCIHVSLVFSLSSLCVLHDHTISVVLMLLKCSYIMLQAVLLIAFNFLYMYIWNI